MANPLEIITKLYLESHRFNGCPFRNLEQDLGLSFNDAFNFVKENVEKGTLTVFFGDKHPNPHIKAFSDEPKEITLEKINKNKSTLSGNYHICVYPTRLYLEKFVKPDDYRDRPYTYEMALGAGQLEFRYFDLIVLEFYRNDPRYYYWCDDINGRISIVDDHYQDHTMPSKDKVFLDTFGFAYNDQMHRAVTTLVYYISKLSAEHQQVWKSRELKSSEYKPHPDYYRNNIIGDWGERIPICNAFLMELTIINQMCKIMNRPVLFNNEFEDDKRPQNFSFLVRPTHKEYYDFVGLLDKMMSDNINKKFFKNEISYETETQRSDGKIIINQKGTITILEEWVKKYYHSKDSKPMDDIFNAFRKVRKERQRPAHAIDDNKFDQKYFSDQRQILMEAYGAIRTLRLIFANHPMVKISEIKIPKDLYEGKIWTM